MPVPAYVSNVDLFFINQTKECAVLLNGPPKVLIRYDALDDKGKADLADLVTANGGSLPLSSITVAQSFMLDNGTSWWDTYGYSVKRIGSKPSTFGSPPPRDLVYYDGAWKYLFNDAAV